MLAKNYIVRSIAASVLLLLFAFSITPKKFLHDAIAHHTDTISAKSMYGEASLTASGFVCKCDNLVAESPFTSDLSYFTCTPPPSLSVQQSAAIESLYATGVFFFNLRGPPETKA